MWQEAHFAGVPTNRPPRWHFSQAISAWRNLNGYENLPCCSGPIVEGFHLAPVWQSLQPHLREKVWAAGASSAGASFARGAEIGSVGACTFAGRSNWPLCGSVWQRAQALSPGTKVPFLKRAWQVSQATPVW